MALALSSTGLEGRMFAPALLRNAPQPFKTGMVLTLPKPLVLLRIKQADSVIVAAASGIAERI